MFPRSRRIAVVVLAVSAIGTKRERESFAVFAFPGCYLRKGEGGFSLET